jgi:amino acid adenylation domain-containing protein
MSDVAIAVTMALDAGGPVERDFPPFPVAALDGGLAARFLAVASMQIGRLAVADDAASYDYAALRTLAARIACALPPRGAVPERVGILLAHEPRFAAAMLGVAMAGHAYVPLDAGYPAAHLAAIANHAGLVAVISAGELCARAAELAPAGGVVDLAHLPGPIVEPVAVAPGDLACILCTSGSTGAPKAVAQCHRGVLHDVMQYVNAVHLDSTDRLTSLYSPATVGAVRDIWAGLLVGASVHMHRPKLGAAALGDFLRRVNPTIYHSVPVLLRHLAGVGGAFESVRLGYVAGDRLDADDVGAFFRLFPQALLYTGLGATETSTMYLHRFIRPDSVDRGARVAVGWAVPERQVLLLNEDGREVSPGEAGEIWVSSPYIALGYWGAPELSAQRFSDDPARPGWRRFRTGDLGRWRADGMLEHLGRADHMVKLGGVRVELQAVEAALKALPGVREAVALVRPAQGAGEARLVAHYVGAGAAHEGGATAGGLLAELRRSVPAAMVPAALLRQDALPVLPNFKVDRAAAARLDAACAGADTGAWDGPGLAEARLVAEAVQLVLELPDLPGPDQDVLLLGADSLALVALSVELRRALGREVSLEAVLAARTPRSLGRFIAACAPAAAHASAAVVSLRAGPAEAAPLLWPCDLAGGWFGTQQLMPLMAADRAWIGLRDTISYDQNSAVDTLEAQASLMVQALAVSGLSRQVGAVPAGFSFAGRQAWELAAQMLEAGWHVPAVVIFDAAPVSVGGTAPPPGEVWSTYEAQRRGMARHYLASRAALDLVLVRCADASHLLAGMDEDLGWSRVARSVRVVRVPGEHMTMWQGEGPRLIAEVLKATVKATCPAPISPSIFPRWSIRSSASTAPQRSSASP